MPLRRRRETPMNWAVRYRRLRAMTAAALRPMFVEDTGRVLIDSGDAYGRQFQHRRAHPPEKEPYAKLKGKVHRWKDREGKEHRRFEMDGRINCMWFLHEHLTYSARMTRKFTQFAEEPDNQNRHWLELMEDFAASRPGASGLYGEGAPITGYTYNYQTLLDQDYQMVYFEEVVGSEPDIRWDAATNKPIDPAGKRRAVRRNFVVLQIHGGCDARWGFTRPRVFEVDEGNDTKILWPTDGMLWARTGERYYTDDGGANWYAENYEVEAVAKAKGVKVERRLDDYPVVDVVEARQQGKRLSELRGTGVTVVGRTGTVYAPITGAPLQLC